MTSKRMLILHISIFTIFFLGSIALSIVAPFSPRFFLSIFYISGLVTVMIIIGYSWKKFGGCPFTVWENQLRLKESQAIYRGSCIRYYGKMWLGINLPEKVVSSGLMFIFTLPVIVAAISRYIY